MALVSEIHEPWAGWLARGVTRMSDPTSGFMAIRKSLLKGVDLDPVGWKIVLEVIVKTKARFLEIPIVFAERRSGTSKLNVKTQVEYLHHLWKLYRHTIKAGPGFPLSVPRSSPSLSQALSWLERSSSDSPPFQATPTRRITRPWPAHPSSRNSPNVPVDTDELACRTLRGQGTSLSPFLCSVFGAWLDHGIEDCRDRRGGCRADGRLPGAASRGCPAGAVVGTPALAVSSAFLYRFALVRPHLLSIALAVVVLWAASRRGCGFSPSPRSSTRGPTSHGCCHSF